MSKEILSLTETEGELEKDSGMVSLIFLKREFLEFDPAKKNRKKIIVIFSKDKL